MIVKFNLYFKYYKLELPASLEGRNPSVHFEVGVFYIINSFSVWNGPFETRDCKVKGGPSLEGTMPIPTQHPYKSLIPSVVWLFSNGKNTKW